MLRGLCVRARSARKKKHQRDGSKYGDAGKCQASVETAGSLSDHADEIGTDEPAEIGDRADQGDARGCGEAGEEFAWEGVERPVDAVDPESGDAEQGHGWERGVRGIHGD